MAPTSRTFRWPLLLAAASVGLTACVSIYKPAAGSPTATLVIDSNKPGFVQAFKSEACDKADAGSRISFLHPSAGDRLRGAAKPIEAGKPLILSMDMNSREEQDMVSCNITGRFTPLAGGVYHLFFRYDPQDRTCSMSILRRSELGSVEPEPSFKSLPVKCHNSLDG
jgi:acyl-coenzyme A thioesterase PaaI-like protein